MLQTSIKTDTCVIPEIWIPAFPAGMTKMPSSQPLGFLNLIASHSDRRFEEPKWRNLFFSLSVEVAMANFMG